MTGLITVSVGNSRTQIGRFEDGTLTASEHVVNADIETVAARVARHWDAIEGADERAIALASVNDSFAHPLEADVETRTGATVERIGRDIAVPIGTQLDEGTRTGLDRLLCAAAAYARVKQACIVIDAGTAVTVDFVDGVGTFQGGAIAPGMRAQFAALHASTDALPEVAPEQPEPEAFGKNTVEAMRQGVYWGIRGLVQKLVERYSEAFGAFPMVIATGGDAELLFRDDELVNHIVPDLALHGIAAAFESDSGHAHDHAGRRMSRGAGCRVWPGDTMPTSAPLAKQSAMSAGDPHSSVSWTWDTPLATGAISICRLLAHDGNAAALEALLHAMTGRAAPAPGAIAHRSLAAIDDGVVVRTCDVSALVMPHGGIAIRHALDAWMRDRGALPRGDQRGCQAGALTREALRAYPEARSPVEAIALRAIAHAASPRAIPLLLAQDSRMSAATARGWRPGAPDEARARRLSRLLRPPLVVAVGAANAGKSSLLNALAGRTVAIAADMPGTTRDCVAGRIALDGLVVDWLDTPGIRDTDDPIEMQSRDIARTLAQRADLVIGIDASDAPLPADCSAIVARAPDIVIRTKSDVDGRACGLPASTPMRGGIAKSRAAVDLICVSVHHRTGLDDLARAVRRALVPDADIDCADPWIFDPALG